MGSKLELKKAAKEETLLRIGIAGISNAGKTWTALKFATYIANKEGKRVALIDTEHRSASLYADDYDFDVINLDDYHPNNYIAAMNMIEATGKYSVIIIDSGSHEWDGEPNGILKLVTVAQMQGKNSFTAWKTPTELHEKWINAWKSSPCHVIVTLRSKISYQQGTLENGKPYVQKLGLQPIQRENVEFEFDILCEQVLDQHTIFIGKTRCNLVDGKHFPMPGDNFMDIVYPWVRGGGKKSAPQLHPQSQKTDVELTLEKEFNAVEMLTNEQITTLFNLSKEHKVTKDIMLRYFLDELKVDSYSKIKQADYDKVYKFITEHKASNDNK